MNTHIDDRRIAHFDIFPDLPGSLNVVTLLPGAVCAWHMHRHQLDYYYVAKGLVKIGVTFTGALPQFSFLKEGGRVFEVPVGVWHGYACVGNEPAILVTYCTHKYDSADEARKPPGPEWDRVNR